MRARRGNAVSKEAQCADESDSGGNALGGFHGLGKENSALRTKEREAAIGRGRVREW